MIHLIDRFTDKLKQGKYNNVTIKSYRDAVFMFYNRFRDVPQNKLNEKSVAEHLAFLKAEKGLSQDAIIQNGKAIKLYFQLILERELDIKASGEQKQIPPYILSKDEVIKVLAYVKNPKHNLIIHLAYGVGLKLNELISLKISDFNFEKGTLTIAGSEPSEDRELNLGEKLPPIIKDFTANKKVTSQYLFSNNKGDQISPRGVQIYFSKTIKELGLDSSITLQNLRHSYAVHLLNRGIDLHHLQKSLGHKYLQTTSLYSSLTDFSIEKMESPVDTLF